MTDTTSNTGQITSSTEPLSVVPSESVPNTDRTTVRIVVCSIALIVLLAVASSCVRSLLEGEPIAADVWDIAKMLGGALIGVLASTRSVKN